MPYISGLGNAALLGTQNMSGSAIVPANNPDGWFIIEVGYTVFSADKFYHFLKNGAAYQVTTGKTFKPVVMGFVGATATNYFQVAHTTTSFNDADATITSGTYQFGATQRYGVAVGPTTDIYRTKPISFEFPSLSYPAFTPANSSRYGVWILGREV